MSFLALLFLVAIILLIVAKMFSGHFQTATQSFPYEKQRQLLTPTECSFICDETIAITTAEV